MPDPAITARLRDWIAGDRTALSAVVPGLYGELRRAAANCLRREWRGQTLQPTALVHEAYAALAAGRPVPCEDRNHFVGIVRRIMAQILIQYARRRGAAKRGGSDMPVQLSEDSAVLFAPSRTEEALEDALVRLRRFEPRQHLIVEMHYRSGATVQEIAAATGVSGRTVERELKLARTWLEQELRR